MNGYPNNVIYMHDMYRHSTAAAHALGAGFADELVHFPDAVVLADERARVTYLNLAAEQLLGVPKDKACGHALDKVVGLQHPELARPLLLHELAGAHSAFDGMFHLLACSDGRLIPVQISVARTRSGHGMESGYIVSLHDASEQQHYIDTLVAQTLHDEHTRLLRRAELVKRLWGVLQESRPGDPHAFLYLDLDKVKAINDQAGPAAGDLAIRQIAACFKGVVRNRDTLAHLGGNQFGLLLERCPVDLARERAQQLHRALASYNLNWEGQRYQLGVSIGLATIDTPNHSLNSILAAADAACCTAKRDGTCVHEVALR